ncbi:MAG TPA: phosphoribosyl-AMP cyclohydrolase [Candidatus Nanoarchaeia archaeon]|nr:phosphoribosyl-AMP cyclohydrolase [Candidatus Nanoarchaeia archaeon]
MKLDFSKLSGLVPTIIQDYKTNKVLMVGFMNEESYKKTLETGNVWYYSRTRNKLWMKGETSGNVQKVKEIFVDCDNDTLLIKAEQIGKAACHEGYESCFFRDIKGKVVDKKVFDPKTVYKK